MYRTQFCPYCVDAAQLLDQLGVDYQTVSLDDHPNRRQATNEILPGHHTVPLVLIGGEPIGGYQELMALHGEDRLRPLIFGDDA